MRERWQNHLDPELLISTPWTEAEDSLLYGLQALLGNRWAEIARALDGRSENAVKNRYNSNAYRRKFAIGEGKDAAALEAKHAQPKLWEIIEPQPAEANGGSDQPAVIAVAHV